MQLPNYTGIVEPWKVALIVKRAERCGFKKYEIPDALQEVVAVVVAFKYDSNHVNGASERTALTTVIDHKLRKMKRSERCYRHHVDRSGQAVSPFSRNEVDTDAMDIARIMADLTVQEQAICHSLIEGRSIAEIARMQRCSWHTVKKTIDRLRDIFTAQGFAKEGRSDEA